MHPEWERSTEGALYCHSTKQRPQCTACHAHLQMIESANEQWGRGEGSHPLQRNRRQHGTEVPVCIPEAIEHQVMHGLRVPEAVPTDAAGLEQPLEGERRVHLLVEASDQLPALGKIGAGGTSWLGRRIVQLHLGSRVWDLAGGLDHLPQQLTPPGAECPCCNSNHDEVGTWLWWSKVCLRICGVGGRQTPISARPLQGRLQGLPHRLRGSYIWIIHMYP